MLQLQCIIKAEGRLGTPTSNGNGVQPKEAAAGLAVEEKACGRGKKRKRSRSKKKRLSDSGRGEGKLFKCFKLF